MNAPLHIQYIEQDGKRRFAVMPVEELEALLERLDEAEAIKAFDAHAGDEAFPETVAERLMGGENAVRVFREYRALSLRDLATRSGLGASYLSDIENGKRKGTVETMKAIAEALGVDLDDLV